MRNTGAVSDPEERRQPSPDEQVSPELALVDSVLRSRLLDELLELEPARLPPMPALPGPYPRHRPRRRRRFLAIGMGVLLAGAAAVVLLGFVPRSGSRPTFVSEPLARSTTVQSNPQVEKETGAVWRTLAWAPVRAAAAYEVQIVDDGTVVFRARTSAARVQIPRSRAPKPGEYRWYVWPILREGGELRRGPAVVDARLRVSR